MVLLVFFDIITHALSQRKTMAIEAVAIPYVPGVGSVASHQPGDSGPSPEVKCFLSGDSFSGPIYLSPGNAPSNDFKNFSNLFQRVCC